MIDALRITQCNPENYFLCTHTAVSLPFFFCSLVVCLAFTGVQKVEMNSRDEAQSAGKIDVRSSVNGEQLLILMGF